MRAQAIAKARPAPLGNERAGGRRGGESSHGLASRAPSYTFTSPSIAAKALISGYQQGWPGAFMASSSLSTMLRLAQEEQLTRPYVQSQVVYACIKVRARAISAIPHAWWTDDSQETALSESGAEGRAFLALMRRPNPLLSRRKFWAALEVFYCLAGGAFIFLSRIEDGGLRPIAPGEMPDQLWPVREDLVRPVFAQNNSTHLPDGWKFTTTDGETEYPDYAVAHVFDPDPYNVLRGVGPLQAAHRRANISFKLEAFDDALVANGGQVGGILIPETGTLGKAQLEQLAQSWREEQDKPVGHRKTAVLPAGIKFQRAAMTPVDMDFANLREWSRDEIMMAFGVTKPLLGITDDVNRANAHEARRVFYESTVLPQTEFWSDEVSHALLAKLPPYAQQWTHQFQIETVAALREDINAVIERVGKLMDVGRSFAEAAALIGWSVDLEGMPGVDDRYVKSALVPVELAGQRGAQPAPPAPGKEEEGTNGRAKDGDFAFVEFASGLTRGERVKRSQAFEGLLDPFERRVASGVKSAMRNALSAQIKRIHELASGKKEHEETVEPRPWEWHYRPRDAWGNPCFDESDEWITCRGVSASEVERILDINWEKWGEELWGNIDGHLLNTIGAAAADLAADLNVTVFPHATDPEILRFMADKEVLLVEGPMSTLREQVKRRIVKAMADTSPTGPLADRIREALEDMLDDVKALRNRLGERAQTIARTETASAANAARMRQMAKAGIEKHEWLSAGDDLVRTIPVRHNIDGETVEIGKRFSNGLRRPGDNNQPYGAGAVANCRCASLPVIPRK